MIVVFGFDTKKNSKMHNIRNSFTHYTPFLLSALRNRICYP